jgi:hypothetical protein
VERWQSKDAAKHNRKKEKAMNGLRMMLVVVLAGTALALSGCGKQSEPEKPDAAHTDDDGHDHSDHEDHTGHNH